MERDIERTERMLDELCKGEVAAIRVTTSTRKEPAMQPHIRWMIRRDMPEVMEIELLSEDPNPWTDEEFIRTLRQRNAIGMVLEAGERIRGYMIYELHKDRLQIFRLAVHPSYRRFGYGRAMLDNLKNKLGLGRRNRLRLEVRESNMAALLFLRANGFRAVNVLRDYYGDEDGYLMQHRYAAEAAQ